MRLRLRLALTTVAVAVPLLAALGWVHHRMLDAKSEDRLAQEVLTSMLTGRADCEADPRHWRGHPRPPEPPRGPPPGPPLEFGGPPGPPPDFGPRGPPPHGPPNPLFAYDAALQPADPDAPALPPDTLKLLRSGNGRARVELGPHRRALVLAMPWTTGPCAIVAALQPPERRPPGMPPLDLLLWPLAAVLGALLLSIGPVIGRIRTLTREVRASAQARYGSALTVRGNDEIAELARAFSDAQSTIRDREKALREFLANTTHDVMMPLTALQGHLAELEAQSASQPGFPRAELAAAVDEAHYLAALVHNLALIARLESAQLELARDPVDLGALLGRATSRHAVLARQHQVELAHAEPPEPLRVLGDLTMIEQAVSNLIANAIVHNQAGGHVAAQLERMPGDRFKLSVVDDGAGVDPEELSRLLERGYRASAARTRAPSGQGLGLHITSEVAKRHGWTLTLRRSEFGGLEIELAGPITPAAA